MPLSAILSAIRSPAVTKPTRVQPARNAQKKPDDSFIYTLQSSQRSKHNSIILDDTVTESVLQNLTNSPRVLAPASQSVLQGNNSICLSPLSQTTIPETQYISQDTIPETQNQTISPDSTFENAQSTPNSSRGDDMFDALAETFSPKSLGNSLCPNSEVCHTELMFEKQDENEDFELSYLVRPSQLPASQTLLEKHDATVQQLILANQKISELERKILKLEDDINVHQIHSTANLNTDSSCNIFNNNTDLAVDQNPKNRAAETQTDITHADSENILLFRSDGNLSILSNFYQFPLRYEGHRYISTEQAYQHQKAVYHKCSRVARQILSARTSAQSKAKSKAVPQIDSWHEIKAEIMASLLVAKAQQNEQFRKTLIDTKGRKLVHNIDTDSYWGCGPDLQGTNILGILLEELRERLITNDITLGTSPKPKEATLSPDRDVVEPLKEDESPTPPSTLKLEDPPTNSPTALNAETPPVLIIGNSNARQMCGLLGLHDLNAMSYCYPGGSIDYIRSRVAYMSPSPDPSHIILMAGDIEAAKGLHPETIADKLDRLVNETRRVFPMSEIILISLTVAGHTRRRQTINAVNRLMHSIAAEFRRISIVTNNRSKLQDNIHLTKTSKTTLCRMIVDSIQNPHREFLKKFR